MSHERKRSSKLATLEAARAIFFIVVGLAIAQSLGLFTHDWPPAFIKNPPSSWAAIRSIRWVAGFGYLFTVLRFSHGVSQLCAFEKDSIEGSSPPSSLRIMGLFLFLTWLGILFYLMADNITNFESYVKWTAAMLAVDFLYAAFSKVVRDPFRAMAFWFPGRLVWSERIVWDWCKGEQVSGLKKRVRKILEKTVAEGRADRISWLKTEPGHVADAAVQWMISDLILIGLCLLFLLLPVFNQKPHERWFGLFLMVAAALDYLANRTFYFGGRGDRRKAKMVFVCSLLSDGSADRSAAEIGRAKTYCLNLMSQRRKIIPFAGQAFYPYFLGPGDPTDRNILNDCALAFLQACDALYVYVPYTPPLIDLPLFRTKGRPDLAETNVSPQMKSEIEAARRLGLRIRYVDLSKEKTIEDKNKAHEWRSTTSPTRNGDGSANGSTPASEKKQIAVKRKRVYVCTMLRGIGWDGLNEDQKEERLNENIKQALLECYRLANGEAEWVAPFAPQAFYPYLLPLLGEPPQHLEKRWNVDWFDRSREVLKICDAIYVYGKHPLPNNPLSSGMKELVRLAENLGMEIQYRELEDPLPCDWDPVLPQFFPDTINKSGLPPAAVPANQPASPSTEQQSAAVKNPAPVAERKE